MLFRSGQIVRHCILDVVYIRNCWLSLEVFNLLGVNNVSSYMWVTDVYNVQYAVPNYLTNRQLNLKLILEF